MTGETAENLDEPMTLGDMEEALLQMDEAVKVLHLRTQRLESLI